MQDIGIFKIDKNMCSNCREDEDCPQKYSPNGNCLYGEKDLKKEQVPENFRELREMCIDLKNKDLEIKVNSVEYAKIGCIGLTFDEDGKVYDCEGEYLATDLTPQQMWNIIKSLVEEK